MRMSLFVLAMVAVMAVPLHAYAQLEKVDISQMKLYSLVVTVMGQEIQGLSASDINNGIIAQPTRVLTIKNGVTEPIKVELQGENGQRIDVTHDPRTSYKIMGSRILVDGGFVTSLTQPQQGMGSMGLDTDAAIIVQFEDLDDASEYRPRGKAGSVYVYFQIHE